MRTLINQAASEGLNGVPLEETYDIIEKAAQDYHLWTSDRGNPEDRKGVQDLCLTNGTNDIAELRNTVKMLATEIKNLKNVSSMKSYVVVNVAVYCQISGSPAHFVDGCPIIGQESNNANQEDANFVGSNTQGDGFSFGSGMNRWDNPNRNNPNLSYKPQNQTQPGFQYRQPPSSAPYQPRNQYNNQPQQQQRVEHTLEQLAIQNKQLAIQNKMLENQIAQQANSVGREPGKLPLKPDPNLRESVNAITLRGDKQLETSPAQPTRPPAATSATNSTPAEEETSKEAENRAENSAQLVEPAPYRPPVPFLQRMVATWRDKEFKQFVDKIRTLYITIPLTDAITQILTYAKFMKEILTGKRKINGTETVAMSEECSAAMHQPMPPKLKDSGSFSIPCDIGGITIHHALCDLGASVSIMSYSLYAKLNLGDLCPTNVTIHLTDRSCRLPRGIIKDVPVKVKNIYIPADFIVLEISEDIDVPIILGRPFLYMAKVVINMDRGSIALRVGSERVVFYLPDM
ncbi:unnamed protein product [Rhodiola kirilowii]